MDGGGRGERVRKVTLRIRYRWADGHEHVTSNGGRFKQDFAERDKKKLDFLGP